MKAGKSLKSTSTVKTKPGQFKQVATIDLSQVDPT
jgi:hypothetical protein